MDRLNDILQRKPLTPAEQAHEQALKSARLALKQAERAHTARVKERRKALVAAEKAHARSVAEAERELAEAARSDDPALRRAQQAVAEARRGRELTRLGELVLYDDRIETPEGTVELSPGVRAIVDAPGNLVQRELAIGRTGVEAAAALAALQARARRSRDEPVILVEAPALFSIRPCEHDADAAREFARRVNVAALNAADVVAGRAGAVAEADATLVELRARRAAAVAAAEWSLERAEQDTAAIEEARNGLADAEADTAEIEASRTALEALEQSGAAGPGGQGAQSGGQGAADMLDR